MTISKINNLFEKMGKAQIKYRWCILSVLFLFSVLCMSGLSKLKFDNDEEAWFSNWDQVKIDADHYKDIFGNDDSVMVLVQAKDVFDPEVLKAIDRLGKRLEAEVPYADRVTSITTTELSIGNDEGFEVVNPFEDGIPNNPEEIKEKKDFILSRESLRNNLVSDDATETWVILSLEKYDTDMEDAMMKIGRAAQNVVTDKEFTSDKYTFKATGMSYTEVEENDAAESECVKRVSIGFVVMLICLVVFIRSLRGVIVPLIATIGGIGSVLGAMSYMNIKANSSLLTLPILLGMALAVGYSVHYINSFRLYFRRTGLRKQSVEDSVRDTGWPILFTVITTVASMLSFLAAGIGPIKWVGGCAASIVIAVYVYVIVLIPILMSFGKDKAPDAKAELNTGATKADLLFEKTGKKVIKGRWIICAVSLAICAFMLYGTTKVNVNMDYNEMMGTKIPYVARLMEILNSKLGSQYSYDVMIEAPDVDAFKNPEYMNALQNVQDELGKLSQTKISVGKPRVTSVTQIVKEMNRTLNGDKEDFYTIPQEQDMLTQLLFLYEISGGDELYSWLDEDYKTTHIHVELKGYDANHIVTDIEEAEALGRKYFPDSKVCIVGEVVNYAAMNGKLVWGELKSFTGSFIIILVLLILAFTSVKTGLIGMMPNIAPVLLIGGVMGYAHFSLDMITMTVMPMILGIAVDDTIHFTNHIKFYYEKTGNYMDSILISYREIGKTMGMTTVILCAMFFVYMFSPMGALSRIGLLSIIGLGSALVADYTLTPALIYLTKPFGKEKNKE